MNASPISDATVPPSSAASASAGTSHGASAADCEFHELLQQATSANGRDTTPQSVPKAYTATRSTVSSQVTSTVNPKLTSEVTPHDVTSNVSFSSMSGVTCDTTFKMSSEVVSAAAPGVSPAEASVVDSANKEASVVGTFAVPNGKSGHSTTTAILPSATKREKDPAKLSSLNQPPDASHTCTIIHPQPDNANPVSPAALLAVAAVTPDEVTLTPNLSTPSSATATSIDGTQLTVNISRSAALASGPTMPSAENAASPAATTSVSPTASAASSAGLNFSAASAAALPLPPELATHSTSSTATASVASHYKTKPTAALSSTSGVSAPNSASANAIAPLPALSTGEHAVNNRPAVEQQANSTATHSAPKSSSNQPAGSSHAQATSHPASQAQHSPATQEKSSVSSTGDNNSNPNLASTTSAHPSWLQTAAAQQTASAIVAPASNQFATQSATQLSTESAAFAPPSPALAQTPAQAQAQFQTNAVADPPRMVDSGQLRVISGSSELKVSVQLPELGKVEVRAVTAHDVTTAHVTAFRADALPALSAERTGLEQALKSRDVILGSFDAHGQSAGQHHQQSFYSSTQSSSGASSLAASVTTIVTAEASPTGFLPDYSSISVHV